MTAMGSTHRWSRSLVRYRRSAPFEALQSSDSLHGRTSEPESRHSSRALPRRLLTVDSIGPRAIRPRSEEEGKPGWIKQDNGQPQLWPLS